MAPVLVLGIGNALMGDDGVGARVVEALRAGAADGSLDLPAGIELVDGGTLGLGLLPWLAEARAAVLVDAALVGGAPGTVVVWRDDLPAGDGADRRLDHAGGVVDLLATARLTGALPGAVSVVGIAPGTMEAGDQLSAPVAAAMPTAAAVTAAEARRLDALTRAAAPTDETTAGVTT